jgi:hypothetical protein
MFGESGRYVSHTAIVVARLMCAGQLGDDGLVSGLEEKTRDWDRDRERGGEVSAESGTRGRENGGYVR